MGLDALRKLVARLRGVVGDFIPRGKCPWVLFRIALPEKPQALLTSAHTQLFLSATSALAGWLPGCHRPVQNPGCVCEGEGSFQGD